MPALRQDARLLLASAQKPLMACFEKPSKLIESPQFFSTAAPSMP